MKHILNIVLTVIFGIITLSLFAAFVSVLNGSDCTTKNTILLIVLLILFGGALISCIIKLVKHKNAQNKPTRKETNPTVSAAKVQEVPHVPSPSPVKSIQKVAPTPTAPAAKVLHTAVKSNKIAGTPSFNIQKANLQTREIQFNETLNLLKTTTNYETFLGRMEFAFMIANETRSQDKITFLSQNAVGLATKFIDRAVLNEIQAINNLKTEKGKQSRYDKFSTGILEAFKNSDTFYSKSALNYLTTRIEVIKDFVFAPAQITHQRQAEIYVEPSPYWRENVSDEVKERFAEAIFLYNSRKGMPLGNTPNDYPQYYMYELNVPHPEQLHRKLLENGLLSTADIKTRIESLTIPEIKGILSKYNLPVSGKKEKLVTTALENIPEEELDNNVGRRNLTMLSANGKSFLSFTEGYAELYRCGWGIYLYEYEVLREQGILNFGEAAEIILKQHDKSPSFSTKLSLAQLYYKQKEYDLSLRYYIQTMFYETCDEVIGFAPVTQERIHKMAEFFSEDMIEQCYKDNPNAKSRISKQRFVNAVHKALSGEINTSLLFSKGSRAERRKNMAFEKCPDCPYSDEPIDVIFKGDGTGKCDICDRSKEFYLRNNISTDDLLPNSPTNNTSVKVNKRRTVSNNFDTVFSNCNSTQSPSLASPNDEPDIT